MIVMQEPLAPRNLRAMKKLCVWMPLVAASLFCTHARAGEAAATAEELFQLGKEEMLKSNFAEACPHLAESYKLDPAGGTLQNLAVCYEGMGQFASAYARFQELKNLSLRATPPRTDRVELADAHLAQLTPRISRVFVQVPKESRVEGLEVAVDGVKYGEPSWKVGVLLDPGSHTLEVSAPGRVSWRSTLTIDKERTQLKADVPVLAVVAEPGVRKAPPVDTGRGLRTAGFVTGGAGMAVLAGGAVFGILAVTTNSAANAECTDSLGCDAATVDRANGKRDDARLFANVANVMIPVGVVAAGAGAVLLWQGYKRKPSSSSASWTVTPTFGGLAVTGSF